jgi:hypothetical protein
MPRQQHPGPDATIETVAGLPVAVDWAEQPRSTAPPGARYPREDGSLARRRAADAKQRGL